MKAKKFLTMAALTMGLAMTGAMMSSCSNQDNPTVDPIDGNPPGGQTIVLSELESDYVAQDGDILTGTLDGNTQPYKISIAEGATVSLSDATIQRDSKNHSWAGITCLGDATIILDGENSVVGFDMFHPGIQPAPEGTTLTIKGEGKLTASSIWAAGIGSGSDMTCGNITIEGGDITAIGGLNAAGIGCGDGYGDTSVCGDITITGGTVVATGEGGAGIGSGSGYDGTNICGDITISGGIVTATGELGAGIGSGQSGTCGNITISGGIVTATSGENGAGIGCGDANSGSSVCGNITITGGTVIATGEGLGAGIGCGGCEYFPSVCSDITIEKGKGFVSVTAIKGGYALSPIGLSSYDKDCFCGSITFNGKSINSLGFYCVPEEGYYEDLIFTISSSDPDDPEKGDTWTLTPAE